MAVVAAGLALVALPSPALTHDCTCRFAGEDYRQGEVACIRDKLARCAMYLNNSSWTIVAQSCPQVRQPHQLSPQQRMTAVPAETVSR